jgi:hypothetical protein
MERQQEVHLQVLLEQELEQLLNLEQVLGHYQELVLTQVKQILMLEHYNLELLEV